MSGQGGLDYAYVLWLWVCSLYATLLTLTVLCVAFLLRKHRSFSKSYKLPQASFQAIESDSEDDIHQLPIYKGSYIIEEVTTSWKNFHKEFSSNSNYPSNSKNIVNYLDNSQHQIHIIKPIDSHPENNNLTEDEISVQNDEFDQESAECFEIDIKEYSLDADYCSEQASKVNDNIINTNPIETSTNSSDKLIASEKKSEQVNSLNTEQTCSSEETSVIGTRYLKVHGANNSIFGETDIDQLSEADSEVVNTYLVPGKVISIAANQLMTENIIDCHISISTSDTIKDSEERDAVSKEIVEFEISSDTTLSDNNSTISDTQQYFTTKVSLEKLDQKKNINSGAVFSKTLSMPSMPIKSQDLLYKSQDNKRNTVVYVDEDGNISITQLVYNTQMMKEDGETVTTKKRTYVYETDTGTISLTQIFPGTDPVIENDKTEKLAPSKDRNEKGFTETVAKSNTDIPHDDGKPNNEVVEDVVKLVTLQISELNYEKKEDEMAENSNISTSIKLVEEMESNEYNAQVYKSMVEKTGNNLINEEVSLYSIMNEDKEKENVGPRNEVQCLCTVGDFRVDIVSEKSNIDMTRILLAGLDSTQNINNHETESNSLDYPNEQVISKITTNKCQEATKLVVKDDPVTPNDSNHAAKTMQQSDFSTVRNNETATIPDNRIEADVNRYFQSKDNVTNTNKLYTGKTDVSIATKFEETGHRSTDQIITLENLIRDTQRNLNQLISHLRKENQVMSDSSVKTSALKRILEDQVLSQKDSPEKSNLKNFSREDGRHCNNLIVYQTATETSGVKSDMLEQEMAVASVNKLKLEMESAANENIIDADYVTVKHRLPIPSSKNISNHDIDKNNFIVLSDSKLEFVDIGCSHSNSPSIDFCPNCEHLESKTTDNSEFSSSSHSDIDGTNMQTESVVSETPKTVEKSLLEDLLYMGETSESYVNNRATIPEEINSECNGNNCERNSSTASNDTLFYITRDSIHNRSVISTNGSRDVSISETKEVCVKPSNNTQPPIQTKFCMELKKPTKVLPESYHDSARSVRNRHFERVVSGDVKDETDKRRNDHKNTDSTKELLDMLATFTNREEVSSPSRDPSAIQGADYADLMPERLVSSPTVHSVVFSKENLENLSTIIEHPQINDATSGEDYDDLGSDSIPERIPQKNTSQGIKAMKTLRFELDDVDVDTVDVDDDHTYVDNDNVYTYVDNDNVYLDVNNIDVYDDYTTNSPMIFTNPLRKTIGEPCYMREDPYKKSHVIPTYLKDVSDGIKALMLDLTKPMADVVPPGTRVTHDCDRELKQTSSSNSTEVQANLFTSSQVDLQPSCPYVIIPGRKLKPIIKPYFTRCSEYYNSSSELSYNVESEKSSEYDIRQNAVEFNAPDSIQFDPTNPLNNVLLPPIDFNVHRYSPIKREHIKSETSLESYHKDDDNVITQYSILHAARYYPTSSDITSSNTEDPNSVSKLITIEESVETPNEINKHEKINTVITMQDNQKLLEGSSSLTLVKTHSMFDRATNVQCALVNTRRPDKIPVQLTGSQIKVIYKQDVNQSPKLDEDSTKIKKKTKCRHKSKTNNSPGATDVMPKKKLTSTSTVSNVVSKSSKHSTAASTASKVESKPRKSVSKSNSKTYVEQPQNRCSHKTDLKATSKEEMKLIQEIDLKPAYKDKKRRAKSVHIENRKTKSGSRSHEPNVIVQQATTEYKPYAHENQNKTFTDVMISDNDNEINYIDVVKRTKADTNAVTSEGEINNTDGFESKSWDTFSGTTEMDDSLGSVILGREMGFEMDWQPELLNELSSKNLVTECDSSADVVENIHLLPFMGSDECAWVSSSQHEWVFRLMQGRLRMVISLARTKKKHSDVSYNVCVRSDTPISAISMEATESSKNMNTVAELSARFALSAMHYFVGQSSLRAGDVPSLLRRCSAVAHIALRWHAAMSDSWLHLGYILDREGWLSLNVTNIPLRSVWCVTMKIELVEDDINEVPWPRASDVKVTTLVAFADVTKGDVAIATRGISSDWGHAPRTLWRMVRYLQTLRGEESQHMNSPASVTNKQ